MTTTRIQDLPDEDLEKCWFKRADEILSTDIGGESVIMNLQSEQYSSFNAVGSVIWNSLAEEKSFFEVLELVLERFEVERAVAQKELAEFLDVLVVKSMVTIRHNIK